MSFTPVRSKAVKMGQLINYDESDWKKLQSQLKFIPDNTKLTVIISEYNEAKERENQRTAAQNRYYHKVLDIICEHTGDTHMDMHEQLKVRFLAKPYILEDKEYMIVKSTTELTTKNFAEYLDKIFHWAAEELQVSLPLASEYY